MHQVLIQTRIEYLRGKIEENQTINHHGKKLEVEGGKVVSVSGVGGEQPDDVTPVEAVSFERSFDGWTKKPLLPM